MQKGYIWEIISLLGIPLTEKKQQELQEPMSGSTAYHYRYKITPKITLYETIHERVELHYKVSDEITFVEYFIPHTYIEINVEDKILLNNIIMIGSTNTTTQISSLNRWISDVKSAVRATANFGYRHPEVDVSTTVMYTNVLRVYFKTDYNRNRLTDDYEIGLSVNGNKIIVDFYEENYRRYCGVVMDSEDINIKLYKEISKTKVDYKEIEEVLHDLYKVILKLKR